MNSMEISYGSSSIKTTGFTSILFCIGCFIIVEKLISKS